MSDKKCNLSAFVEDLPPEEKEFDPEEEWKWAKMPEYKQEQNLGIHSIIVHFETGEDIKKFSKLIDQPVLQTTKWIWYPAKERQNMMDWVYVNEP
jgi:hypothetical protein